jgi:hypothetical protein
MIEQHFERDREMLAHQEVENVFRRLDIIKIWIHKLHVIDKVAIQERAERNVQLFASFPKRPTHNMRKFIVTMPMLNIEYFIEDESIVDKAKIRKNEISQSILNRDPLLSGEMSCKQERTIPSDIRIIPFEIVIAFAYDEGIPVSYPG